MSRELEIPVKVCDLAREMQVGATYMTELLKACGLAGQKRVMKSQVLKFLRDHPKWKMPAPDQRDTAKSLLREALDILRGGYVGSGTREDLIRRIEEII